MISRDELAARLAVAHVAGDVDVVDGAKWAEYVVDLADALLARLASSAPVAAAPASGAPAPSRPEWVRLNAAYMGPSVRRVLRWVDGGSPVVLHSNGKWELPPIPNTDWEPCEAPASPAVRHDDPRLTAPQRPASPAVLPAAAPVDREGLARAIYEAVRNGNPLLGATPWGEARDVTRRDAFHAADAAVAFLRGGAA